MSSRDQVLEALQALVAPLVHVDGGELYLIRSEGDEVALHLAGTCSGCPGATLTTRGIIEPALRTVLPQLRLVVTTGMIVPEGATRLTPNAPPSNTPPSVPPLSGPSSTRALPPRPRPPSEPTHWPLQTNGPAGPTPRPGVPPSTPELSRA
jgi:Fe-S cluster biogenesis protein NfuA